MGNKQSTTSAPSTTTTSTSVPKKHVDINSSFESLEIAARNAQLAAQNIEKDCEALEKRLTNFSKMMDVHLRNATYFKCQMNDDFHAKIELRKKKEIAERRERTSKRLIDMNQSRALLLKNSDNIEMYRDKLKHAAALKASGQFIDTEKFEALQDDIDEMRQRTDDIAHMFAPKTDILEDQSIEDELNSLTLLGPMPVTSFSVPNTTGQQTQISTTPAIILPMPVPPTSAPKQSEDETERELNELLSS
jgi:hypothetical protein